MSGVDLSPSAIALARQNFEQQGLQADLREADGEHLPFADESFDLVYAHGVVQYTADPQALVNECRRVLKPGGEAMFQVYNRDLLAERVVEVDEGAARARGCAGAPEVQRRRSSVRCLTGFRDVRIVEERFPVKSRLHKGWKGTRVQHVLRRHVQRAAPRARPPVRLAPPGVLPQMTARSAAGRKGPRIRQRFPARPGAGHVVPCRIAPALTVALCERHRGIGADGLIVYVETPTGASMQLLNADGSHSEVSGNGVRCLGAWLASRRAATIADRSPIESNRGGDQASRAPRRRRRTGIRSAPSMGFPEQLTQTTIDVHGSPVEAVTLRVGNPQCVVLGEVSGERLHSLAAALSVHPHFPAGTNVELATVEAPDRVRILIWERGVGPTEASGTGACAAAVAAIQYAGAARDVQIVSPGGAQRVEWTEEGLFLTGWAELVAEATWLA